MATAHELVIEAERRGAHFRMIGERLEASPARVLDEQICDAIGRLKPQIMEVLRSRAIVEAEAIACAQRLLRECHWIATPRICQFLIGHPGEACKRCGASWLEHYAASSEA